MKKIFIFALVLATAATVNAQSNKKTSTQPKKAEAVAPVFTPEVEGPEAKFETLVVDYGQLEFGADGNREFKFKNVGSEPLVISNAQPSCGCTVPNWPRDPIMPGETSSIKVGYDTKRVGQFTKTITVTTNGKTDRVVLRITGTVNPQQN